MSSKHLWRIVIKMSQMNKNREDVNQIDDLVKSKVLLRKAVQIKETDSSGFL